MGEILEFHGKFLKRSMNMLWHLKTGHHGARGNGHGIAPPQMA